MPGTRGGPAALALLVTVLLAGCGEDEPANEPDSGVPTGDLRTTGETPAIDEVATGLVVPWGLVPLDDGSLLVGARDAAEVSLVPADGGEPEVVGRVDGVRAQGESGLLGLALSPDGATLFAYRTGESENGVVAMTWDGERLGEPTDVVTGIPGGASFHQGGALAVGPDGLLYVGTGDNGVPDDAQDDDSLSGKVLRYTLDGEPAPDNPSGTAVLTTGHRNVEGLVFDDDGRLWAAEFGQDAYDELNLVEAGNDYGWPEVEGTGGGDGFTDPSAVWATDDASPSGIGFWDGSLWLAALRGETLWEVPLDGAGAADGAVSAPVAHLTGRYGRLRNAVAATDGSALWLVTSNTDGRGDVTDGDDRLLRLTR
ncbi:PQQ-dependent sugar dehydrogenase [Nocardioides marinquilinus]|uniref:PQQ-dependent sugar dehydrogenase n=1 Tax=Nocardioides marinquilinus TaxID=1210400 RepID=A0ABP9Q204_9ACTN